MRLGHDRPSGARRYERLHDASDEQHEASACADVLKSLRYLRGEHGFAFGVLYAMESARADTAGRRVEKLAERIAQTPFA